VNLRRILVLDDEPETLRLCERLLVGEGFLVDSFADPNSAIEYGKSQSVDLLLVDIGILRQNGMDVITHVQESHPGAAVLVMTESGKTETAIHALRQGVDGLILKPFKDDQDLIRAVRQALLDRQNKHDVVRIQALRPLFGIAESLLAETRPERLLELILNALCGILRCEHAGYYQYSPDRECMHLMLGRGKILEILERENGGIVAQTDSSGVPMWVNTETESNPRNKAQVERSGLGSVMCAATLRSNVRGVFYAGRVKGEKPFCETDWEMFLLLSRQASVALENASLYSELRSYVKQIEDSQQALIRAEKMAAVGRMTASIAHEINNPLQAMSNCLHLAAQEDLDTGKRSEYISLAQKELERLMQTVQRMLNLFRPGGEDPQRINLADLLRQVLELLSPQLEGRNIRVTTGISSKLPPILAVSSQIQQVFLNLVLNAYDAMPEGGELRISARPVKDLVEVTFHDTGPGIPAEDRARIFEPFVSTKEGGTGLGLSVSYGIVSAHGGNLSLVMERNSGACFRVTLPVKRDERK